MVDAHYAQEGARWCPRCKSYLDWGIDGDWTGVCFQQIVLFVVATLQCGSFMVGVYEHSGAATKETLFACQRKIPDSPKRDFSFVPASYP